MKKLLNLLSIVAIVATMFGCTADVQEENFIPAKKRIVTVTAGFDEETRTVLNEEGKYVDWDEYDYQQLQLIECVRDNSNESWEEYQRVVATGMTISNNGSKGNQATFTFKLEDTSGEFNEYQYRAILIYNEGDDNNYGQGAMENYRIKNSQDPTKNSFDPRADILVASPQTFNEATNSLDFKFRRAVALNKLILKNMPAGEDIRSVSFATSDEIVAGKPIGTPIVGEVSPVYDDEGNLVSLDWDGDVNGYDNQRVTMTYDNEEVKGDKTFDVYFITNPVTLQSGKKLTIRVVTTEGFYRRVIELPRNIEFKTNTLNILGVDMTGTKLENNFAYKLVTAADLDENPLKAGQKIIITNADATQAISITQNSNNRGQAAILASAINNAGDITAINEDVQELTLVDGSVSGTFALFTGSGYLYAASSTANHLKTQTSIDGNASFKIEIAANGVATIIAQGNYTHNQLKHTITNKKTGTGLFSCYTEGQNDVKIYRASGTVYDYPSIQKFDTPQYISSKAGTYYVYYALAADSRGGDDFKVISCDGCVKTAVKHDDLNGVVVITVDENTTGSEVDGDVIIASTQYPDITSKINVKQLTNTLYTLRIDKDVTWLNGSSYESNNGNHNFTLTTDDGTTGECEMRICTNDVNISNQAIQLKKGTGKIYNKNGLNGIRSIAITSRQNGVLFYKGASENPSTTDAGFAVAYHYGFTASDKFFSIVSDSEGATLVDCITITFEGADAVQRDPLPAPTVTYADLDLDGMLTAEWNAINNAASYDWELYKEGTVAAIASGNVTNNYLVDEVENIEVGNYTLRVKAKISDSWEFTHSDWSADMSIVVYPAGTKVYTLDGEYFTSSDFGVVMAYANDPLTFTIGGAEWTAKAYKQAAADKYIQIRDNAVPSYIAVTIPEGKDIRNINMYATNGTTGIFGGNIYINESATGSSGTHVASDVYNSETTNNRNIEIPADKHYRTLYIQASGTCRIWKIEVVAFDYDGEYSGTTTPEPTQLTKPVVGDQISLTDGKLSASWTGDTNASSYSWWLKNGSNTVGSGTGVTGTSLSEVSVSGVTAGTTYTFTVQAIGNGTTYSNSEVSNGKTVVATATGSGGGSPTTETLVFADTKNDGDIRYVGDVTFDLSNNDKNTYSPFRWYGKKNLVISVPSSKTISSITWVYSAASYVKTITANTGAVNANNGTNGSWSANGVSTNSVTLTNSESAQARLTSISVTYTN